MQRSVTEHILFITRVSQEDELFSVVPAACRMPERAEVLQDFCMLKSSLLTDELVFDPTLADDTIERWQDLEVDVCLHFQRLDAAY